jgi:hypothetical protein
MGYGPGKYGGPAYQIGVDVMKVKLPQREHFARFVGSVDSQVKSYLLSSAACCLNYLILYPLRTDDRPRIAYTV